MGRGGYWGRRVRRPLRQRALVRSASLAHAILTKNWRVPREVRFLKCFILRVLTDCEGGGLIHPFPRLCSIFQKRVYSTLTHTEEPDGIGFLSAHFSPYLTAATSRRKGACWRVVPFPVQAVNHRRPPPLIHRPPNQKGCSSYINKLSSFAYSSICSMTATGGTDSSITDRIAPSTLRKH